MPKLIKNINKKVVVFDLDETLGYFGELGRFCNLLDEYYKNPNKSYSIFNELMDLYPEFIRPNIMNILKYLIQKKKENKCQAVMIYTNNTGERKWAEHIKGYFEHKLTSKIFEQIIAAFKINGKVVEINRTSHDKCVDDFFRCTRLPPDIEICFVDDIFHPKMSNDNVYYIHVKEYKHMLPSNEMLNRYLNSPLSNDIKNKDEFLQFSAFNLKYNVVEKDKHEHDIDIIVSKKMLEHIKEFFNKDEPMMKLKFYNKHQKSFKKNNKTNNNTNTNTNNKTLKKNK
jgi:hypothetical protein